MKLLFYLLLSAFSSVTFSQTVYPDIYLTEGFKGIIFGKAGNPFCNESAFNPKRKEIDEAEKYIKNSIDSLTHSFNKDGGVAISINKKFNNYKRQYFGCCYADNKKVLKITFDYTEDLSKINWDFKEVMLFSDGWDNHWSIEFDLSSKKLLSFSVNSMGG